MLDVALPLMYFDRLQCLSFWPSKLRITLLSIGLKVVYPLTSTFPCCLNGRARLDAALSARPFLGINLFDGRHILLYVEVHYK
jgi:hypothetical protein